MFEEPYEIDEDSPAIAVVGMACRFPGAKDVDTFWENIASGVESITHFSDEELLAEGLSTADLEAEDLVKVGAVLDDIEMFDAEFFGFSPREADLMDPQNRFLLECSHEALEHAGYDPERYQGRIGVYVGAGFNKYLINNILCNPELVQSVGEHAVMLGNGPAFTALQISYRLNLHGPSVNISTACSTSLVAIHEASKSLLSFESDMVLAGGVTIKTPHRCGYRFIRDGVRSPDGHCRAFDAAAAGTVFGNGAGMVLLKRLEDAVDEGNTIYALIRGTAINNDGSRKVGIAAPSVSGQRQVIKDAQAMGEIAPESITYVETHGTGTVLGDPIEFSALREAFEAKTKKQGFCAIGSVKTNVGHLDYASGVAGFIKTVLALVHRKLPPSLNFENPNPAIDFAGSPFYVNTKLTDWDTEQLPRRGAVSSFGMGGTNAHVILEEIPARASEPSTRSNHLLLLSAHNAVCLERVTSNLCAWWGQSQVGLPDIAFTLQMGRRPQSMRRFLVCRELAAGRALLGQGENLPTAQAPERAPKVNFIFPGQGTQHVNMGRDLYREEPIFREALDQCFEKLKSYLDRDLKRLIFPTEMEQAEAETVLQRTRYAQPALFSVAYASTCLLASWGVYPAAMLGHSLSEYLAATLAGVFSLDGALRLVAERGRLMDELPSGSMLAVSKSEDALAPLLSEHISLAAVNGPEECVLSGELGAIEDLAERLPQSRRLVTSHAFHSSMMDPILENFQAEVAKVAPAPPEKPFISSLTGTWITPDQATDPRYWADHLRGTVRFNDGLEVLLDYNASAVMLEVGPHTLTGLVGKHAKGQGRLAVSCLPHPKEKTSDSAHLLRTLGRLWLAGVNIDFKNLYQGESRLRVPLPTYPFDRKRHWVSPPGVVGRTKALVTEANALPKPTADRPGLTVPYLAPGTEMEKRIAECWIALLGISRIGVNDNFFDLGGDSLVATQLLARLRSSGIIDWSLNQFFEEPSVAALARHAVLSVGDHTLTRIPKAPADQPVPLAYAQRRLWFIDQLAGPQAVYNIPQGLRMHGELDRAALGYAIKSILDRHQILTASFHKTETDVFQSFTPIQGPLFYEQDLEATLVGLGSSQEQELINRLVSEKATHVFNLEHGPLWHISLVRLSDSEHVLMMVLHHTVADAWSLGVLIKELVMLYTAFCENAASPLPNLPVQYADYACWQRNWMESIDATREADYWMEKLVNLPPTLALPLDKARPESQTYRGGLVRESLPKEFSKTLHDFGRAQGVTLFVTMLAAYTALLHRYSGQDDFAVGTPIAGRLYPELEALIGMFVNTLVLRTPIQRQATFETFLGQVKRTSLDAFDHQHLPFERVVDMLDLERSLSHTPLFQVMFVLLNVPKASVELPGLQCDVMEMDTGGSMFDLTLWVREHEGELSLSFEYNADLFEHQTIERMKNHYLKLLHTMLAHPAQVVSRVSILGEDEQHRILYSFNDTRQDYPGERCLHRLIEAQAARSPHAIAVTFEQEQLSYAALLNRTGRLARRLAAHGVGPEVLVGVCLERSIDLVISLLAILRAGGAYLPLDPEYPSDRLAFMLEDTQAKVLLVSPKQADVAHGHKADLLLLNGEQLLPDEDVVPAIDFSPLNPAYCIFTSGSTGKPKGVLVSHFAICNRLFWKQETYGLQDDDRVLQKTPFSFDVSVWEFFWAHLHGARLVVARPGGHQDPNYLRDLIIAEGVTTVHFVPSMLRAFLAADGLEACTSLRRVFASGEALPPELAHRVNSRLNVDLHNLYGPTEAAIDVTAFTCPRTEFETLPIGKPIANTQTYILDSSGMPVAVGFPGELYLAGDNLARGYINRPQLTAEKFGPHPFANEVGLRLYRTGDLARFIEDGQIEYLGRIDRQVKLRGFRIEIGEIEIALAQQEGVADAVVLLREDTPGNQRLTAYLTLTNSMTEQGSGALDRELLRRNLGKLLPEYMIPGFIVVLDHFPVTANGKLDRRALSAPEAADHGPVVEYEAPQTRVEGILTEIWQKVLGRSEVSTRDNFFSLGGDSIVGIQIVSLANKAGLRLTPRHLFQHQTIAELARVAGEQVVVVAEQGLVSGTLPLTPVQRRFFEANLRNPHHYNQSLLFKMLPNQTPASIKRVMGHWLAQHDVLRLRFTWLEGNWHQELSDSAIPVFEEVDLSSSPAEAFGTAVEQACARVQASLNLEQGPLLSTLFIHGGANGNRLLLVIHHLAVDGVSWRILLEDLVTIINTGVEESSPLPPKTTSFKEWSHKLGEFARSAGLSEERSFWVQQALAPVIPLAGLLQTDRPNGVNTAVVKHFLDENRTISLLQEASKAYSTYIDELLLTALLIAFRRVFNTNRIKVDLEGHGRQELFEGVDLLRTVGWFTTIYPVVLEMDPHQSLGDSLKRTKEQIRSIPNKGIGYGLLRYLSGDHELMDILQNAPQAQVLFNYLGQLDRGREGGLGLLQPAPESGGPERDPMDQPFYPLEINCFISGGRLHINWTFNSHMCREFMVNNLAEAYQNSLIELIEHCLDPDSGGFTVSDLPEMDLDQDELDLLMSELD